jgi:hypothetical protein
MESPPLQEHHDIGRVLSLPFQSKPPAPSTDALKDVHIRFSELVNYVGQALLDTHLIKQLSPSLDKGIISPNIKAYGVHVVATPDIAIQSGKWESLSMMLPERLFYSAIVQLATLYEVYLGELIADILWRNDEWLEGDERQLTTKEIFKIGNIEDIRAKLIDRKILDFAMLPYPKKVERFQKEFRVGIHHKTFPLSLFQVHDFLEVRNVIVHSDGHASDQYLDRMSGYEQPPLLQGRYETLEINFSWLLTFGQKLIWLCNHVDEAVQKKWETTGHYAT